MTEEALSKLQGKINAVASTSIKGGELHVTGGDYDIYVEPVISKDGITFSVYAFGHTQSVLVTWAEFDEARNS